MPRGELIGAEGIEAGRRQLAGDAMIVTYRLTPAEAEADEPIRAALDPRSFAAARLAREAGFAVELKAQEWDNGEIFGIWDVTVPPEVGRDLRAMVWDSSAGVMEYTLTRSTRHPGWQLTTFSVDGEPWSHADLYDSASEAFDTAPTASGVPLAGLHQVVFRDGRVLVREGAKRVEFNPAAVIPIGRAVGPLKRRLMR